MSILCFKIAKGITEALSTQDAQIYSIFFLISFIKVIYQEIVLIIKELQDCGIPQCGLKVSFPTNKFNAFLRNFCTNVTKDVDKVNSHTSPGETILGIICKSENALQHFKP